MPTVRVEPDGLVFEAEAGSTVMAAAWRSGLWWPTVCEGKAECTTCHVRVLEGIDHLGGAEQLEMDALWVVLRRYPRAVPGSVRLACQAVVRGDVTVFKRGVRARTEEGG